MLWRPKENRLQYDWLETGWPQDEEELKQSRRRLGRLVDWFLEGSNVMPFTMDMPGELYDENADVCQNYDCLSNYLAQNL